MSLNSRDNQTEKKTPQAKDKNSSAEQSFEAEKSSEKAKKEKKKKGRQGRCKMPNPTATGANAALAIATGCKKQIKKKKAWDVSKITYYSCNKNGYYASDYTKSKN